MGGKTENPFCFLFLFQHGKACKTRKRRYNQGIGTQIRAGKHDLLPAFLFYSVSRGAGDQKYSTSSLLHRLNHGAALLYPKNPVFLFQNQHPQTVFD